MPNIFSRLAFKLSLTENLVLTYNEPFLIAAAQELSFAYNIFTKLRFSVKLIERFGKNIEFKILQDGRDIYDSGVKAGCAEEEIEVEAGLVTLVITNANLLESKQGFVTVLVKKITSENK